MNIKKVCKNVGYDGKDYFCMRCGKAGFETKAQAVGHQSQCKAKNINLGVLPPPPTTTDHHQTTTIIPPSTTTLPPPKTESTIERQLMIVGQQISEIKQKQDILSNETTHMVAMNNQSSIFDSKGLLMLIAIGVVAYLLGRENCSCDCSVSGTTRKTKSSGIGSAMGTKIFGKFIDKVF